MSQRVLHFAMVFSIFLIPSHSTAQPAQVAAFAEEDAVRPVDVQSDDRFGRSISVSGETAIVGAPTEDGGSGDPVADAGAAYIFQFFERFGWFQIQKLTAPVPQVEGQFGTSVMISGDLAIVGAPLENTGPGVVLTDGGAAYVFARDEGGPNNWGQVARLTPVLAQAGDHFGESVAISGATAVVGAANEDGGAGDPLPLSGAAYVFGRDVGGANNWGQVIKLTASDAQAGDEFGRSVAVSTDIAVIGAWQEDGGSGDPLQSAGAAYVFGRDAGGANNWGQVAKLTASDAQENDEFGGSVAISGDLAVAGAESEEGGPGDPLGAAGAAYVFARDEGGADSWGELARLSPGDAQSGDQFGISVAVSGNLAVIGAWQEGGGIGDPLSGAGAAYVFAADAGGTGNWGELAKLSGSDAQAGDNLGFAVAVSGDIVAVGAWREDGGPGDPSADAGTGYFFRRERLLEFFLGDLSDRAAEACSTPNS
jgi:hypothetical protein